MLSLSYPVRVGRRTKVTCHKHLGSLDIGERKEEGRREAPIQEREFCSHAYLLERGKGRGGEEEGEEESVQSLTLLEAFKSLSLKECLVLNGRLTQIPQLKGSH